MISEHYYGFRSLVISLHYFVSQCILALANLNFQISSLVYSSSQKLYTTRVVLQTHTLTLFCAQLFNYIYKIIVVELCVCLTIQL